MREEQLFFQHFKPLADNIRWFSSLHKSVDCVFAEDTTDATMT